MFKKLLKYDFRAIWRVWWIIAAGMLLFSVIGGVVIRFAKSYMDVSGLEVLYLFAIMLVSIGIFIAVGSVIATQIMVYYRYYKNLFTDEGYLTFTLPVSRKLILLSKTVNAIIWNVLQVALLFFCGSIMDLFSFWGSEQGLADSFLLGPLLSWLEMYWWEYGAWLIPYAIVVLLIAVGVLAFSVNLFHFCITVGAIIAKKAKLLASIGVYYLVNLILNLVLQIFGGFFASIILLGLSEIVYEAAFKIEHLVMFLLMLIVAMIVCVFAIVMYGITLGKLERKLNLA